MLAPAKVIVGCSTAGLAGREGEVMKKTLPYGVLISVSIGCIAWLVLNLDTGLVPEELARKVKECPGIVPLDEEHKEITRRIAALVKGNSIEGLSESVLRAASLRRFLG